MDEPKDYAVRTETPEDKTSVPLIVEIAAAAVAVLCFVGAIYLVLHVDK